MFRLRAASSLIVQQILLVALCTALVLGQQKTVDQLYVSARGGDKAALQQLVAMGNAGNGVAQLNLAGMYATGQGVPKDISQAVSWTRKAADSCPSSAVSIVFMDGGNSILPANASLRLGHPAY